MLPMITMKYSYEGQLSQCRQGYIESTLNHLTLFFAVLLGEEYTLLESVFKSDTPQFIVLHGINVNLLLDVMCCVVTLIVTDHIKVGGFLQHHQFEVIFYKRYIDHLFN